MKRALLTALAALAAMPACGKEFKSCADVHVGIEDVLWSDNPGWRRSFENGKVEFILVDRGEPVATSFGLAIVIPGPEIGSLCFATLGYTGSIWPARKRLTTPAPDSSSPCPLRFTTTIRKPAASQAPRSSSPSI